MPNYPGMPASARSEIRRAYGKNQPGVFKNLYKGIFVRNLYHTLFVKPEPGSGLREATEMQKMLTKGNLSSQALRYRLYHYAELMALDLRKQVGGKYKDPKVGYNEALDKFTKVYVAPEQQKWFRGLMDQDHAKAPMKLRAKLTESPDIVKMVKSRYNITERQATPQGIMSLLKKEQKRAGRPDITMSEKFYKIREGAALLAELKAVHARNMGWSINWADTYSQNYRDIVAAAPENIRHELLLRGAESGILKPIPKNGAPANGNSGFPGTK